LAMPAGWRVVEHKIDKEKCEMPGSWDPQVYRERAQAWQAEADKLTPGQTKDAALALAEGYARLAALIEQDRADRLLDRP
jgi:hypothetical protein